MSGILLWLASPAVGIGWAAWFALVPVAVVALRDPVGGAGRVAVPLAYGVQLELLVLGALPLGLAEGHWGDVPAPFMIGDSPLPVVALVLVPLLCLGLWALRLGQPRAGSAGSLRAGLAAVLVVATAWTALDFLRVKLDPGGYWGVLFLTQHDLPPRALAALGGPWLISFAVVAVNWALALIVVRCGRLPGALSAAAVVVGAVVAAGGAPAGAAADGAPRMVVAAVQPGYNTVEDRPELRHFRPGSYDLAALDTIADLGGLTRRAAARGAQVVVWPEAALWVDPRGEPRVRRALADLARESGATIAVPIFLRGPAHGATLVVRPEGEIAGEQAKRRPMWFMGEDGGNRRPPEPVRAAGTRIGALLGVDNEDAGVARGLVAAGAGLLASSTHDWEQLSLHQRAHVRLNATATATPLIRADWRFGSMVADTDGRELASAPPGQARAVVTASVRSGGTTPYVTVGDAAGWISLAVVTLLAGLGVAGRARRA